MKNSQLTGRMVAPRRPVSHRLVSRYLTPHLQTPRAFRSLLLCLPVLAGLSSLVDARAGHCQLFNNIPTGAYKMNTAAFVKDLDTRLKGHCVGFAYVVSYKSDLCTMSAGGEARRAQDQPARAMTMLDKFNVASLSKTITATWSSPLKVES